MLNVCSCTNFMVVCTKITPKQTLLWNLGIFVGFIELNHVELSRVRQAKDFQVGSRPFSNPQINFGEPGSKWDAC